jgi:hypothetical protein
MNYWYSLRPIILFGNRDVSRHRYIYISEE